jgi:hypothetical protein
MADLPSDQWRGSGIDDGVQPTEKIVSHLNAAAWNNVHEYVLMLASEAR